LDLGPNGQWDIVPGKYETLQKDVRTNLAQIEAAFWRGHSAFQSKASMVYGRVYDAPKLTGKHQIGTMGNVLQHLRDPIGALMALADCVTETIIVTETLWLDNSAFKTEAAMLLVPRADRSEICQTWWQVSIPLVRETLRMLGFPYLKVEYHSPLFHQGGKWKPIKHMTWVGRRQPAASGIDARLESGFLPIEHSENAHPWVWAAGPSSSIEVSVPGGVRGSLRMRILDAAPQLTMKVLKAGKQLASARGLHLGQEVSLPLEGEDQAFSLTLTFDRWNGQPSHFAEADPRPLSVAFSSIRIVTDTQEIELIS
jgi:hypothetical protein